MAVDLLEKSNLDFKKICQDELGDDHPFQHYSSPTLLFNDEIVFGSKAKGGGCSLGVPSTSELLEILEQKISAVNP